MLTETTLPGTDLDFTRRLRATTDLLESIVANRGLLALVPAEERRRLLQAAGQVYNPDVNARRRMVKFTSRQRKNARAKRDEDVLADTGIRALRRKAVFTTPNVLPPPRLEPPELEPSSSSDHLPDITRCAASATASAINAPSLLALDMTFDAACEALSAASIPASRILRRAAGLALIAAAAAARPAPSISRLIAALVILSTADVLDFFEREEPELFFVLDFAMAKTSRCSEGKTLQARNGSVCVRMSDLAHSCAA